MWLFADMAERKKDGSYQMRGGDRRPGSPDKPARTGVPRIATHADMALPWGTSEDQARDIAKRICRYLIEVHRVGVQWACHTKTNVMSQESEIDHLHFLWTTRTLSDAGFGRKARSLNAIAVRSKSRNNASNPMTLIRHFAANTIHHITGVYWDPRSFADRGIDLVPEPKLDRRRLREEQRREAKDAKRKGTQPGATETENLIARFREVKERERRRLLRKERRLKCLQALEPAKASSNAAEAKALRRRSAQKQQLDKPKTPLFRPASMTQPSAPRFDPILQQVLESARIRPINSPPMTADPAPAITVKPAPAKPSGVLFAQAEQTRARSERRAMESAQPLSSPSGAADSEHAGPQITPAGVMSEAMTEPLRNPVLSADGSPVHPDLEQAGLTALVALGRRDDNLLRTAIELASALLQISEEAVWDWIVDFRKWLKQSGNVPSLKPLTLEECKAMTERYRPQQQPSGRVAPDPRVRKAPLSRSRRNDTGWEMD
jgi:hypothetical protein